MSTASKERPEFLEQIDRVIAQNYKNLLAFVGESYFEGKPSRYSMTPEDVLQESICRLYKSLGKSKVDLTEVKDFKFYVFGAIRRNSHRIIVNKHNHAKVEYKHQDSIADAIHGEGLSGIEEAEVRNTVAKMNPILRGFAKDLMEGKSVRKTIRNHEISSVGQFYLAKENLKREFEKHGYTNE